MMTGITLAADNPLTFQCEFVNQVHHLHAPPHRPQPGPRAVRLRGDVDGHKIPEKRDVHEQCML